MTTAPADHDPLFGVTRSSQEGCVIVRWSQMTPPEEQEKAWRDYENAFGKPEERDSK